MAKSVIIIPARYNSSRFPGKPLTKIAGKTMLQRVYEIAMTAIRTIEDAEVYIATDDSRIEEHAREMGAQVLMTPESCTTGSDRALAACQQLPYTPDIVVNLQGDAPLTPPHFVHEIVKTLLSHPDIDVATPVTQLSWSELDEFRERKKHIPFSGTTVAIHSNGDAFWFSKQILPAMCKEAELRKNTEKSPVFRHIGLYGFQYSALQKFVQLPKGKYEVLEGLEQLRLLENGLCIKTVCVSYDQYPQLAGVDTLEDAKKAEELLLAFESA